MAILKDYVTRSKPKGIEIPIQHGRDPASDKLRHKLNKVLFTAALVEITYSTAEEIHQQSAVEKDLSVRHRSGFYQTATREDFGAPKHNKLHSKTAAHDWKGNLALQATVMIHIDTG